MKRNRPPDPTGLLDHPTFRKTPSYARLCEGYGIDPALPWEQETLGSIADAVAFLAAYEQLRRGLSPWTPQRVAAWVEGLVARHEGDSGAPVLIDRHGHIVAVQTEDGQSWMIPVQLADEGAIAHAMMVARVDGTPPS